LIAATSAVDQSTSGKQVIAMLLSRSRWLDHHCAAADAVGRHHIEVRIFSPSQPVWSLRQRFRMW
jgi:hypothetical protein